MKPEENVGTMYMADHELAVQFANVCSTLEC